MLDEVPALRAAAEGYRTAAIAAGYPWPASTAAGPNPPLDLVRKVFDVEHVPEQLLWMHAQGWDEQSFVDGVYLYSWPTEADARSTLDLLTLAGGVPFHWRHQIPLFSYEQILYMFVLAGDHAGEVWRYEIDVDNFGTSVRAATSLAGLFDQWTKGLASGLFTYDAAYGFTTPGNGGPEEFDAHPELDVLAFPVYVGQEPWLRDRQRECGVDMASAERDFDAYEQVLDEAAAIARSLGLQYQS